MGCHPLGKIVSKALGKCNGRERRWREERLDYAMAYPPGPPTETHYMRPVARAVTFSGTNSVYVIPPEQPHQQGSEPQSQTAAPAPAPPPQQQQHEHEHHPAQPQPQHEPPAPAQDAPPAEPKQRAPKRGKNKKSGRVRFGPEQQQPPDQQQPQKHKQEQTKQAPGHPGDATGGDEPGRHSSAAPPGYFRYTPSPLPRWEAATPKRHEYFSGEYRYSYPTPVREGIYRIATDANRLTTIFSEENPNACTIV